MQEVKTFSELIPTALATGGAYIEPPTTELTVAEKEQRIKDILVEEASDAVRTGNNVNWRIGRAAVKFVETFAAEPDGTITDKKKKACLKEFATTIGMYDNRSHVTRFYNVAAFWPEASQTHFKDVTWTRFETCAKHCRDLSHASTILHQFGEAPVAKVREAILGKPAPRPTRVEYPIGWRELDENIRWKFEDWQAFKQTLRDHPDAVVQVVVTYPASTGAKTEAAT